MVFCVGDCPDGWLVFNGQCYKHQKDNSRNWTDAESICQRWFAGAHLASVQSAEEQRFVQDNFPQNIWLGGNDRGKEGTWTWSDGASWDYSDWGPGNPDNHGAGQDCLLGNWHNDLQWDDEGCYKNFLFLCKK